MTGLLNFRSKTVFERYILYLEHNIFLFSISAHNGIYFLINYEYCPENDHFLPSSLTMKKELIFLLMLFGSSSFVCEAF